MDSSTNGDTGQQVQSEPSSTLGTVVDSAKEQAGKIAQKGSEITGQALDSARGQIKSTLDSQKDRAATSLTHVADAVRSTGRQLEQQGHPDIGRYASAAADQVGSISNYLSSRSLDDVVRETEELARREPALFLGGALAIGILAGRFLRSSSRAAGAA